MPPNVKKKALEVGPNMVAACVAHRRRREVAFGTDSAVEARENAREFALMTQSGYAPRYDSRRNGLGRCAQPARREIGTLAPARPPT